MGANSWEAWDFDIRIGTGKQARVLRVLDLSVRFQTPEGSFVPVRRVSFNLQRGGSLGLIGESGSGKTTVALSLLRLLPQAAQISGRIELSGTDLLGLSEGELTRIRGARIAMVFHDPLAALNPVLRIGTQIAETIRAHRSSSRKESWAAALELLREVGLVVENADRYPHQLSGGMRQRALIAMALACFPAVLVADEPTSALDPVVQAGIVALLRRLRDERGAALLLATHDLGLAARLCDRIAVLYAGRIVEHGTASEVLARPRHPYTLGLLRSLPPPLGARGDARLQPVAGSVPSPWATPAGCRFRDRCPRAEDDCAVSEPELLESAGSEVACFHPQGER
jgi:oligopeptide/dipeptide ABC transporter ATP-binding protein